MSESFGGKWRSTIQLTGIYISTPSSQVRKQFEMVFFYNARSAELICSFWNLIPSVNACCVPLLISFYDFSFPLDVGKTNFSITSIKNYRNFPTN